MIIPIFDDYRIKTDERCWIVQKFQKGKKQRCKSVSWYPNLPTAVQGVVERAGREFPVDQRPGCFGGPAKR